MSYAEGFQESNFLLPKPLERSYIKSPVVSCVICHQGDRAQVYLKASQQSSTRLHQHSAFRLHFILFANRFDIFLLLAEIFLEFVGLGGMLGPVHPK